ncbi:MAG TPA: cytochrome c [Ignavibacteriaceae bacterium]|nr:cytochrome c [Ignavibacteriaceae bacterium]
MTKPQIWVASFLFLFIVLFLLNRLTKEEKTEKVNTVENPVPQTDMSSEEITGTELVKRLGCTSCHGPELKGSKIGPDLSSVKNFWSRDQLINYLRNPNSYMDTERMQEYKKDFPGTIMPPFNQVDVKDLGKIADFLLQGK